MNNYVKNKWTVALIWGGVIAMIIWVIAGTVNIDSGDDIAANQETYTTQATSQQAATSEESEEYFIIRAENNNVSVFLINETGKHLYRETSIAFELLSDEDQQLLENGVRIESEEELAGFLENYDS